MSKKQMPPVPPANREPQAPHHQPKTATDTPVTGRRADEADERARHDNLQQNTRNQGNPTSR